MNSFIVIEGIVFWILLIFLIIMYIAFIIFALAYIKAVRKNDRLVARNKHLREKLALTQEEYYKATFKVPEVDKDV